MEYGVFSDVHGNLRALEGVWDALQVAGLADRTVFNAGDVVGYGEAPEACVRYLRTRPGIITVRGNYDKNVAAFPEREAEYGKKWGRSRPDKYEAIRRDSEAITAETRQWLADLPAEVEMTLDGADVLMTHYAPGSKEGLGSWTPDTRLAELAETTDAHVVVCGHTHTPFVRTAGGVLWVNPGSLGRSWDGRFRYAVLTLAPDQPPTAQLRQVG